MYGVAVNGLKYRPPPSPLLSSAGRRSLSTVLVFFVRGVVARPTPLSAFTPVTFLVFILPSINVVPFFALRVLLYACPRAGVA